MIVANRRTRSSCRATSHLPCLTPRPNVDRVTGEQQVHAERAERGAAWGAVHATRGPVEHAAQPRVREPPSHCPSLRVGDSASRSSGGKRNVSGRRIVFPDLSALLIAHGKRLAPRHSMRLPPRGNRSSRPVLINTFDWHAPPVRSLAQVRREVRTQLDSVPRTRQPRRVRKTNLIHAPRTGAAGTQSRGWDSGVLAHSRAMARDHRRSPGPHRTSPALAVSTQTQPGTASRGDLLGGHFNGG
jgi:hypothetical protein